MEAASCARISWSGHHVPCIDLLPPRHKATYVTPPMNQKSRGCDKEGTGDSHLGGTGDALYDTKNLQVHNSCATVLQSCLFFCFYPGSMISRRTMGFRIGKNILTHAMSGCVNFTLTPSSCYELSTFGTKHCTSSLI